MLDKERLILDDYFNNQISGIKLAKKYGYKTSKSIYDIIRKNELLPREHQEARNLNKAYIDFSMKKIDCKEKAYFLGIMLTDGYINSSRNSLGIDMCDEDVIKFLSEYINCTYIKINCQNHITKHKFKQQSKYRILLYSKELIKQLIRLSVVKNKSLNLSQPRLYKYERKYINYILRGIIDGDGWVRKDGKEFFICGASKDFIEWCKVELENIGMTKLSIKLVDNGYNGVYYLRSAIKENIAILKNVIYNNDFGMKRKYLLLNMEPSETIMETSK